MDSKEREDDTIYKVVVDKEGRYSIWPADRENALGWNDAGKSGTRAECLAFTEEALTDAAAPQGATHAVAEGEKDKAGGE